MSTRYNKVPQPKTRSSLDNFETFIHSEGQISSFYLKIYLQVVVSIASLRLFSHGAKTYNLTEEFGKLSQYLSLSGAVRQFDQKVTFINKD